MRKKKISDWSFEENATLRQSDPLIFQLPSIFLNFHAANKHINQSRWLCRTDVTFVSEKQALVNKPDANCKSNNPEDNVCHRSVGLASYLLRCSLRYGANICKSASKSNRHPKIHPELVVVQFQLFYESKTLP